MLYGLPGCLPENKGFTTAYAREGLRGGWKDSFGGGLRKRITSASFEGIEQIVEDFLKFGISHP